MPPARKFGRWPLIAFTTLPALAIGMTLWVVSDLFPPVPSSRDSG